jgi:hypothetical protein
LWIVAAVMLIVGWVYMIHWIYIFRMFSQWWYMSFWINFQVHGGYSSAFPRI